MKNVTIGTRNHARQTLIGEGVFYAGVIPDIDRFNLETLLRAGMFWFSERMRKQFLAKVWILINESSGGLIY